MKCSKPDIQTREKLKFQKRWSRKNGMKQTLNNKI